MIDSKRLYDTRFTTYERIRKRQLWQILCRDFLQHFIGKKDTVVDLGAGHCEFINQIFCGQKFAIDINHDIKKYATKDVRVIISSTKHLKKLFPKESVDVVFISNILEHLDSKEDVFRLLNEAYLILKKGGRLLVMQPDINLVGNSYWDFFDHKVALTRASLVEALLANNFTIGKMVYPFLPYSTKVRFLPLSPTLLRIYLKLRPLQILFGRQFFVSCEKKIVK